MSLGPPTVEHEPVHRCGSYGAGHEVHWIQALHSSRDGEIPPEPGRLVDVSPDGTLRVQIGGTVRKLWNHDPERLTWLATRNDGAVTYQPRWSLLRTESPDGSSYCFSVVAAAKHRPCPKPPRGVARKR